MDCAIGGQISVDIYPMGCDKSQAILYIRERNDSCPITFYGDKLVPGGNDMPVFPVLNIDSGDAAIPVEGWKETMKHLREVYDV